MIVILKELDVFGVSIVKRSVSFLNVRVSKWAGDIRVEYSLNLNGHGQRLEVPLNNLR